MGGWRTTYVSGFYANRQTSYSVTRLENLSDSYFIPRNPLADPASTNPALGLIRLPEDLVIPWAVNPLEIRTKALLFRKEATSQFDGIADLYMFQDEFEVVCWTRFRAGPAGAADPTYENRITTQQFFGVRVRWLSTGLTITSDGRVEASIG